MISHICSHYVSITWNNVWHVAEIQKICRGGKKKEKKKKKASKPRLNSVWYCHKRGITKYPDTKPRSWGGRELSKLCGLGILLYQALTHKYIGNCHSCTYNLKKVKLKSMSFLGHTTELRSQGKLPLWNLERQENMENHCWYLFYLDLKLQEP